MGRFIFDITDEQRAKLDRHRARRGLRSLKEAVLDLIEASAVVEVPIQRLDVDAEYRLPGPPKPTDSKEDGARTKKPKPSSEPPELVAGLPVQVGPATSAPGSRLKKR